MTSIRDPSAGHRVHPRIERLAAYSWRLLVIAAATLGVLWLARELAPVLIPATVALFLTRLLTPISDRLRRRTRPGLAAAAAMVVFVGAIAGISILIVPPIAQEAATLPSTITEALDDIEQWLVEDSPFDVSREAIDRFRTQTTDRARDLLVGSGGRVVDGATLAAEVIAGLFLSILFTFFMLRDGARFSSWLSSRLRPEQRERAQRAAQRGWSTLGGYLRGAAMLGIVESIAIGLALLVAGGSLVVPVMVLTFIAAFVPILGAVLAGVTAVLVALVTGGVVSAAIVGVVALVVQQLDNDVLAPWVYGRSLALHPVVILVSVVGGGALFGLAGTLLAVPVVAVAVSVAKELAQQGRRDRTFADPPDAGGANRDAGRDLL
jgi:predicted PurR-regulated permease PerM